jgi:hypothetical protein
MISSNACSATFGFCASASLGHAGNATKLLEARTRLAELRIAERANRVVDTQEVTAALQFLAGTCVTTFESLPGMIAKARTDPALRVDLIEWVRRSRSYVADAVEQQADSLVATGEAKDLK